MGKRKRSTTSLSKSLAQRDKNLIADLKRENEQLKKMHDEQQRTIEQLRSKKYRIQKAKAVVPSDSFLRLVVPDTHGCFLDHAAFNAMLNDVRPLGIAEVVCLGDHLDCNGFLSEHHTLGHVSETEYSWVQDMEAANSMLDELQGACVNARYWYLEGNHEYRIRTWCIETAKRKTTDAAYFYRMHGTEHVLHLEDRGIAFIPADCGEYNRQGEHGVLERGPCLFMHGSVHAKNACQKVVEKYAQNCVIGHIHRRQSYATTNYHGEVQCWCPGTLSHKRMTWHKANMMGHVQGYGLQVVNPDLSFFHLNVPIINGESYLRGLLKASG